MLENIEINSKIGTMKILKGLYVFVILLSYILFFSACKTDRHDSVIKIDREPFIEPDYSEATIPYNIAPLNFIIKEEGLSYRVNAFSSNGKDLSVKSSDGIVKFPVKSWKRLLENTQGGEITFEIVVKGDSSKLTKYNAIHLHVANEPIDSYLCYRLLYPSFETWAKISIIQRSIEDFNEEPLIENKMLKNNCMNCHTFNRNNPEKFLIHIRGSLGDTYFIDGKDISRRNLKTKDMPAGAVYPCWHPDGRYVAFSSNKVRQTFHEGRNKFIEVFDVYSSLVLYDTFENRMIPVVDKDSVEYMETFPEWSPDGKYLYFCRTEQYVKGSDYKNVKYDLVRRAFDQSSQTFGKPEVVFDAHAINKSVSFPKISPDGKYLVFTLHDYGTFSIRHRDADLYLIDLQTKQVKRMDINSNESESYHSWSSNSKWLVFSSKRGDGMTARPYFAYIGSADNIGKPFVLPQEDPTLYKTMLETFNKPEFITGEIHLDTRDFLRATKKRSIRAKGSND